MRNNNPKENNRQPFRPFLPQVPKIIFENFARKDNEPWAHYEFRVRCLFGNLFLETFFGNQVSNSVSNSQKSSYVYVGYHAIDNYL